jgi:ABC-type molybdenum transport system ATPase subunit/photorepair protein PhrA
VSAPGDTSVPAVLVRAAGLTLGGSTVLSGLDLEIAPGERVAVLGRSGAGKTSLLSLLNGSRPPSSGHVHVLVTTSPARTVAGDGRCSGGSAPCTSICTWCRR